jgi:hypothetical protein
MVGTLGSPPSFVLRGDRGGDPPADAGLGVAEMERLVSRPARRSGVRV